MTDTTTTPEPTTPGAGLSAERRLRSPRRRHERTGSTPHVQALLVGELANHVRATGGAGEPSAREMRALLVSYRAFREFVGANMPRLIDDSAALHEIRAEVSRLTAALAASEARVTVMEAALNTIARGVWIAKADACLDTIGFIAREGLRKAVQDAKTALAAERPAEDGGQGS